MMHRACAAAMMVLVMMIVAPTDARACANPVGVAGEIVYNETAKTFQYCNATDWVRMNKAGSGSGGCTNPTLAEGELVYSADARALQGCAGNVHKALGAVGGAHDWVQVSGGATHACAIRDDGKLFCWGYNFYSQLGDNSSVTRTIPTPVNGSAIWKQISAGVSHVCGIKSDDTAWCWGRGDSGQLGNGTWGPVGAVPVAVSGGATWKAIRAGNGVTCGIKSDDTAWCWGAAANGRLGNGTTTPDVNIPSAVAGGGTWKAISVGWHSCGIKSDDTLWCWGNNGNEQVGDGTTMDRSSPVTVTGGGTWKAVSVGGYHTCAIKSTDAVYCWGYGNYGQLGGSSFPATPISGGGSWKSVAMGEMYSCGIKSDDTAWCWGSNGYGQLGDTTTIGRTTPVAFADGGTWLSIGGGGNFNCGIKDNGSLWCSGSGTEGALGNDSDIISSVPVKVYGSDSWLNVSARGGGLACGVKSDNTAWCWGNAGTDAGGDFNNLNVPTAFPGGGTWKTIGGGGLHANGSTVNVCGIKSDDTAWCWAYGGSGQLGNGTNPSYTLVAQAVSGGGTWKSIGVGLDFACGIKSDDTARCWGAAANGRLGNGTTTPDMNTPQTLSGGGTWKSIIPGDEHACGIKFDDTAWCWGAAANGRLGNGTTTPDQSAPATLSGGGTWSVISAGGAHSCGIKMDGTAWCWGTAANGRLGNGTTTPDRSAPFVVSGGGTWTSISAGYDHSCGIKSDNTLRCWGANTYGQVGDSTMIDRNSPVAVNGGGTWKSVMAGRHFSCGIAFDDKLRCWGYGTDGQLGDGETGFVTSSRLTWCSGPAGNAGTIVYNSSTNILQYCDGAGWVRVRR